MSTDISCPACGATYKYRPEFLGKRATCSRCKESFEVSPPVEKVELLRDAPPPLPQSSTTRHENSIAQGIASKNEPFEVKLSRQGRQSVVDILEYQPLRGCKSIANAQSLYFAHQQGMVLKQARITLDHGGCRLQAGMLQFLRGAISIETGVESVRGLLAVTTKGPVVKPHYSGVGQIFLEPTFGQLTVINLENEQMVVADGMFCAVESTITVQTTPLVSPLAGNAGPFQASLQGTGWVVLSLPVPENEVLRYTLNGPNDELKVDGRFGILRRGDISFAVEQSTKTFVGSIASGEGMLHTFRGTGEVWIAPTMAVY